MKSNLHINMLHSTLTRYTKDFTKNFTKIQFSHKHKNCLHCYLYIIKPNFHQSKLSWKITKHILTQTKLKEEQNTWGWVMRFDLQRAKKWKIKIAWWGFSISLSTSDGKMQKCTNKRHRACFILERANMGWLSDSWMGSWQISSTAKDGQVDGWAWVIFLSFHWMTFGMLALKWMLVLAWPLKRKGEENSSKSYGWFFGI